MAVKKFLDQDFSGAALAEFKSEVSYELNLVIFFFRFLVIITKLKMYFSSSLNEMYQLLVDKTFLRTTVLFGDLHPSRTLKQRENEKHFFFFILNSSL